MRIHAMFACVLLSAASPAAHAATFSPDMWVYELTFDATYIDPGFDAFRRAEVPTGTPVPAGCEGEDSGSAFTVWCDGAPSVPEMLATAENLPPLSGHIAFNTTSITCTGALVRCPATPVDEEPPPLGFLVYFDSIVLDAVSGRLDYCANSAEAVYAGCFSLSPGSAGASITVTQDLRGAWSFGTDGRWFSGTDTLVGYSGSGRLISSPPSVIPLPAPVVMLGSALAHLGGFSAGARRGRASAT